MKRKPLSTRARLLKEKREADAKRREEVAQKKITDWLKTSVQRMEDKKLELAQLQAMKRRKDDARRKQPSDLYRINFEPSPHAKKILDLLPAPAPPQVADNLCPSPVWDPLTFPTLSSSIKEEVLKNTPPPPRPRRSLFSASAVGLSTPSRKILAPATPENAMPTIVKGCPSKDEPAIQALNVLSSPQPDKTGNSTLNESQCEKKEKDDGTLC